VALVWPGRVPIAGIVAWSRSGEIAHAVPFQNAVVGWLRPGDPGPARATVAIASGVAGGRPWIMRGYVGPWGECLGAPYSAPGSVCGPGLASLLNTAELVGMKSCGPFRGATLYLATTEPAVRSVRLRLSDGSARTEHPAAVGRLRAFALSVPAKVRPSGWTAYGAAGQVLGDGPGWSCP
jgi:hypothetical protein